MTSALHVCSQRCDWCWRDIGWTVSRWQGRVDSPEFIIDGCIKEHEKYLHGFGGNRKTDKKRYREAMQPLHFAISLSGEPTMYPKLPELIQELHKRKTTSFLVTNGTNPTMLKKLSDKKIYPTQLYITLPAPNKLIYTKTCNPLNKNNWDNIIKSLKLLKKFPRSTIRLTLVKNYNMVNPKEYAKLIKIANPKFIEAKAYMWVGYSRQRLQQENMPLHSEIRDFAEKVGKLIDYRIIDEKENSRVVLMMKKASKDRFLDFN